MIVEKQVTKIARKKKDIQNPHPNLHVDSTQFKSN